MDNPHSNDWDKKITDKIEVAAMFNGIDIRCFLGVGPNRKVFGVIDEFGFLSIKGTFCLDSLTPETHLESVEYFGGWWHINEDPREPVFKISLEEIRRAFKELNLLESSDFSDTVTN